MLKHRGSVHFPLQEYLRTKTNPDIDFTSAVGAVVPPGVLPLWQSTGAEAATEAGRGRQWCFPSLIIFLFCIVM